MGLSNDQKAILRLLTQRGEQGYEDLAALMGIDAAAVHERAQEAAAELESEGIPAPAIPPPPGASPGAEPAAPARPSKPEPKAPAAAATPTEPPRATAPSGAPSPSASSEPRATRQRPKLSLPTSGGARAAIAAGAVAVALLIAILLLSGGDSGDSSTTASGSGGGEETVAANANPKLTQAVLGPVDGSDARGLATFGRVKNTLALQIEAQGLEPTAKGESYTVWLYQSPTKKLPLASTAVGESGKIGAQVEVPTEVLAYLANETFDQLDVSRTSDAALKTSLAKATSEKKAPIYTGTDVLRGPITGPIIGAANRQKSE
jgi:hypothetical protein